VVNWEESQNTIGKTKAFHVVDEDGDNVDLTGYTVKLRIWRPGSTALKVNKSGTIVNAEGGTCTYTLASGDLDETGDFRFSIVLTTIAGVNIPSTPQTLFVSAAPTS